MPEPFETRFALLRAAQRDVSKHALSLSKGPRPVPCGSETRFALLRDAGLGSNLKSELQRAPPYSSRKRSGRPSGQGSPQSCWPPSTVTTSPVMNLPEGAARYTQASATSCTSPALSIGLDW